MKKLIILICSLLILLSGCMDKSTSYNSMPTLKKYQRISLKSETLDDNLDNHIDADTSVINASKQTFSEQFPIYEIKERNISENEFQEMLAQFGMEDQRAPYLVKLNGNEIEGMIAGYGDYKRGHFDSLQLTDEELEQLAWDTFNKIPFLTGDYEYLGIRSTATMVEDEGEIRSRVGVSFCRVLDDSRVVGNDECVLCFDGSGLVEVHITLFDYEQVGTMDMVKMEDAAARIKTPDAFSIDTDASEEKAVDTLRVDRVKMLLFNQHSNGCTILQPVYNFIGTATFEDSTQADFSSMIIAIPESYTYEAE